MCVCGCGVIDRTTFVVVNGNASDSKYSACASSTMVLAHKDRLMMSVRRLLFSPTETVCGQDDCGGLTRMMNFA